MINILTKEIQECPISQHD